MSKVLTFLLFKKLTPQIHILLRVIVKKNCEFDVRNDLENEKKRLQYYLTFFGL